MVKKINRRHAKKKSKQSLVEKTDKLFDLSAALAPLKLYPVTILG